jgi:hypothetical protein
MKNKLLFVLLIAFFPSFYANSSPYYFSLGGMNVVPISKFKETNKPSLGFNLQFQDRSFCNLWYGFRFDYSKLDSLENVPIGTNFFNSYLLFSPEIRYVYLFSPKLNYDDTFYLFLQGLLHFSSITRKQATDESNLGLGGSLGGGIGFCFNFFSLCWSLEFDALFSSANFILKSNQRPSLTNYNFGLTLGVRL